MGCLALTTLFAFLATAAIVVTTLAGGIAGMNRAAAHGVTPVATRAGEPSCTADLGIVRSTETCVNVVHASPDAPPVNVLFNGKATFEGLCFGTASGFASVPAGTSQFQIVLSDEGPEVTVINIVDFELVARRAYEVALVGSLASIEAVVNEVNVYAVEGTSQAGSSRIRLINSASDLEPVNLDLIGGDIATRQVSNLAFPAPSEYAVIAAGKYQVRLTASASGEELVVWPEFTFERDTVTSLYVIDASGDDTLTILPVTYYPCVAPAGAGTIRGEPCRLNFVWVSWRVGTAERSLWLAGR